MNSTGVNYSMVGRSDLPVTLGAEPGQADRKSRSAGEGLADRKSLSLGEGLADRMSLSAEAWPAQADRKRRYIQRDGSCRVAFHHVPGTWGLYVTDIFTTLVEIRWRVMFLLFSLSYILSWLLFGLLFWVIALAHGEVQDASIPPCVDNVRGFTAAFLFSLETQTTIGYGFRGMTENCAEAIAVVTVQDVLSCVIDTVVIGIVVAKMASARKRAQTVGFSSCAVIGRGTVTSERRAAGHAHHADARAGPWEPAVRPGAQQLGREDFELVVSFTYTGDSTGILHQTRSSYRPGQIRWGARFRDVLRVQGPSYRADYALFHQTLLVPLPALSARDQDRCKNQSPAPAPGPAPRPVYSPAPAPGPAPAPAHDTAPGPIPGSILANGPASPNADPTHTAP
ncbi:hypothetical protein COCON_G00020040 [Conger conger]|uniref:Inward rectifier potassium channel 16 n=1 Tax=Conger conger TaxID=82655 RepID=A0A9Q1I5A9_CONCO|nr:hypothetical protein COCON_G00020040 [Conger conger]